MIPERIGRVQGNWGGGKKAKWERNSCINQSSRAGLMVDGLPLGKWG